VVALLLAVTLAGGCGASAHVASVPTQRGSQAADPPLLLRQEVTGVIACYDSKRSPTRGLESSRLVLEGQGLGQGLSFKVSVGHPAERQAPVTFVLFVVTPPVVVLCVLIFRINHAEHFAPQAYYRKKTGGAPIAFGYESLGPRPRRRPPSEDGDVADRASRRC
jgi:hypothetical protein